MGFHVERYGEMGVMVKYLRKNITFLCKNGEGLSRAVDGQEYRNSRMAGT